MEDDQGKHHGEPIHPAYFELLLTSFLAILCESTPDHPLFHPCKCSGSIRFVHQDCLLEWLSHSKKKYCELCEYPFVFTPIYRDDMPERIPLGVLIRQCTHRLATLFKTVLRALVVALVWLVALPYLTLWTWRFYFWSGESIVFARRLSNNTTLLQDISSSSTNTTVEVGSQHFFFNHTFKSFLSECFEGQMITAFVIVVFVAAYLFREWVIQNTPTETGLDLGLDENEEADGPPRIDRNNPMQQQLAVDALMAMQNIQQQNQGDAHDRERIRARLEGLREELERNRQRRADGDFDRHGHEHEHEHEHDFDDDDDDDDEEEQTDSSSSYGSEIAHDLAQRSPTRSHSVRSREATPYPTNEPSSSSMGSHDAGHEEDGDEDGDGANTRHSLFSSWREEHDAHESTSAKMRWRAPEFSGERGDAAGPSGFREESIELEQRQGGHLDFDPALLDDPAMRAWLPPPAAYDNRQESVPHMEQQHPLPPQLAPPQQQQPDLQPQPQWDNPNDNRDPLVDDDEPFDLGEDIDGVLEAIGMRGNPWMLVQNSVLMSLMISLCLGVAIWIPYVIGRLVILIRPISFIQTPIYILRLVTDPVLDFTLDYAWPFLHTKTAPMADRLPESIQVALKTLYDHITAALEPLTALREDGTPTQIVSDTGAITGAHSATQVWMLAMQDKLEEAGVIILDRWHRFALGQTGLDRSVCILMGYMVLILLGSWYLARSRHSGTRNAGGTGVNDILRQQGVFLKVFFFIVLELVVFPTVCGILIDLATLPLFVDATVASRWAFFRENPYSGTFLHWFVGTGFMFHFAVFVTLCREIVRPGVMWFIRDPNDPQFHPVQEMIERPILTLMRKIGASAMMYSILIVAGIGTVTFVVSRYTGVYPLHWPFDTPISTLAVDLLAAQFLVPPLISYIKPREFSKKVLSDWWRATSRHLRLTSFMFNGRYPEEEGTHVRRTLKAWLLWEQAPVPSEVYADVAISDQDEHAPVIFRRDGSLARVPKHDSVPVLDDRRMIVPVDPILLEPIDPEERRLGHPAASETGDEENNTTVVYLPPRFKLRVTLFLFLMWLSGSTLTCSITIVPLLLGRHVFDVYLGAKVHDMYAFIAGAYIMVFLSILINWAGHKMETLTRNGGVLRMSEVIAGAKDKLTMVCKLVYLAAVFAFIIPLLIGVAADLFIFMPIRLSKSSDALVIHMSEDWSFGVVYLGIFYGVVYVLPNNVIQRTLDGFTRNGLGVNTWALTRSLVLPIVLGATGAIVTPGAVALSAIRLLGLTDPAMHLAMFRCAYPIAFCVVMLGGLLVLLTRLVRVWLKAVRDDTYLVGKQLHNLDEQQRASTPNTSGHPSPS
ncbi:hypothetical protein BCR43DRAFT_551551 [Syncephalastrum racemosum]|uniref:RING-type E3 ubiquitin transferase n=1 Tax=Syncephalastrum racemosum TaxID=13706 RepID=A0A1X2H5U6_SYNRA|nr:hypothetical protein BCR43DRAFT_551551 [Syncephalastrum racemosum]